MTTIRATPPEDGGAIDRVADVASVSELAVTFRRGRESVRALRGVDLTIGCGEILGLVGESGSGKSALGLALLGLLPRDSRPEVTGEIMVGGVDMLHASEHDLRQLRRHHLGAIFQDPLTSLNPTMRIGRQVIEAAGSQSDAIRLLDAVGVPEPRRRLAAFPHELSGGLRQRVMIAMAVAGSPALVVADEPTTALDVTVQAQVLDLIGDLRTEFGCSFLLITHDLGVASQVADRISVLYSGRVVENGTVGEILSHTAHPYTRGLLRSRLTLQSRRGAPLPTLPGEPPDPAIEMPGCAFAPRCALADDTCRTGVPEVRPAQRHSGVAACVHLDRSESTPDAVAAGWPPSVERGGTPAAVITGVEVCFPIQRRIGRPRIDLHALRGVDLTIEQGESIALVGESGCGKSTLLRVVAGLRTPTRGRVELGSGAHPQLVFQDAGASLTPWLTVGEQIGERLLHSGMSRMQRQAKVADVLALVGLNAEIAAAKPAQLSGGQRQRVAVARATVVPPEVLLCDEPTSALDVSLAATVLNLLGRMRRELGMAMLFVTHDLSAARLVADRIAVMYLGRIVEVGTVDEITTEPRHPYTRTLVNTIPGVGGRAKASVGEPPSPLAPPAGCAFRSRCPIAIDRCASEDPALLAIGSRSVACLRANDALAVLEVG